MRWYGSIPQKIWQCLYCGAEIEREETYDGLFTIKNVVRQSLLDTAYRRLDSAQKNLIECEKIDSRYVGTLIAKIAYEMISVITPGACDPNNTRNVFAQLKKNYEQLREIGTTVTDDEEALYEFLEESDIFATLLLVYDSLNDVSRRDFVANLIEADDIYSKAANTNLLTYSIKNSKLELADKVLSNTANLDVLSALSEVLNKYPDNEAKATNVGKLFATGEIKADNKSLIENYLSSSDDAVNTKASVLISAIESGVRIGVELIINTVLSRVDAEQAQAVLSCLCKTRLDDEDTIRVLAFAYECGNYDVATVALKTLKESAQYVLLPAKYIISMLGKNTCSAEQKVALLKLSFEFKIENKSFESIVSNYLCFNLDDGATRKAILDCLFERSTTFPTSLVETYVLKCSADGERKPDVIKRMFDKGLNTTFFNDYKIYDIAFMLETAFTGAFIASLGIYGLVEGANDVGDVVFGAIMDDAVIAYILLSTVFLGITGFCVQWCRFKTIKEGKITEVKRDDCISEGWQCQCGKISSYEQQFCEECGKQHIQSH